MTAFQKINVNLLTLEAPVNLISEVTRYVGDSMRNFRLVCHNCGHKFPLNTAMASVQDCCEKSKLHVHDTDHPCDRCDGDDIGFVPVYASGLILSRFHDRPLLLDGDLEDKGKP